MKNLRSRVNDWAIDTSAKIACYLPVMSAVELFNGLEPEQVMQSRGSAVLVDTGAARVYNRFADYLSDKFDVDIKDSSPKAWALDSFALVSVYTPIYAGILAAAGADSKQMVSSLLMGAGIATATSKPFRKYALAPWRERNGHSTTKLEVLESHTS